MAVHLVSGLRNAHQTEPMRLATKVLGAVGGIMLVAALVLVLATGRPLEVLWVLMGPTPFYVTGLWLLRRKPESRAALWLLGFGVGYLINTAIGDELLPVIRDRSWAWVPLIFWAWADLLGTAAGIGLFGLFPDGRPQRPYERRLIQIVVAQALVVPVLYAIMGSDPADPLVRNPFHVAVDTRAAAVIGAIYHFSALWLLAPVVLLALRYRRTSPADRRRIRWLVVGMSGALILWTAAFLIDYVAGGTPASVTVVEYTLWPVSVVFALGAPIVAIAYDGVFGIDQPLRRAMVFRTLWTLIAVVYVGVATAFGLTATHYLRPAAAVLLAVAAALLFQPVQRRLERLADRWVFGDRLDGYRVLTRFGTALQAAPSPAELLPTLAAAVRDGLRLDWVRVTLEPGLTGTAGDAGDAEPVLVVPLEGGRIECGPRRDGELLDEDRRLLLQLAGQAAPAVRNLHLTAELTERLETIRRQAAELSASRARVVQAQDAERRRIQRDLHDGVQQDVVVLTTKLAIARERLRRGHEADQPLAELQEDLGRLLGQVREFAHTIHPPVLADQGLLEAIEAHAARLPLAVVIEADTGLRGARYPQPVEAATWYVLSEALTNVVKHAHAHQVSVTLRQPNGRLTVEIRDDGCGFDPGTARGLGLTGLADRVAIAQGTLRVDSRPGAGTTLCVEIPVTADV